MIKLYLKAALIALIMLSLSVGAYFVGFSYLEKIRIKKLNLVLTQGNFLQAQALLENKTKSSWKQVLQKFNKTSTKPISIVNINKMPLNFFERKKLLLGEIIFSEKRNLFFLNYGIVKTTAFKRIANTNDAIKMPAGISMNDTIASATALTVSFIAERLANTTASTQSDAIKTLEKQYGIPMHLYSISSKQLSKSIFEQLKHNKVAYLLPPHSKKISMIYVKLPIKDKVLALGPIVYSEFSQRLDDAQRYYFYTFAVLTLLSVLLATWFFSRNVRKIFKLTELYGNGQFNQRVRFSRVSILNGVHSNIVRMGDNLNNLITTQKNMSRFVAHELRTPLYSMQLVIESLNDIKNLPHEAKALIESMQGDVEDLNRLISQFLLYSRGMDHTLTLKTSRQDINKWLADLVLRRQHAACMVTYHPLTTTRVHLDFDDRLLKHAVENVLINALKFAKSQVVVALAESEASITITIDDDGPGLLAKDKEVVFNAFTTLGADQSCERHMGLGLAIAKSIVELHSGKIFIENSPLGGARVVIQLAAPS